MAATATAGPRYAPADPTLPKPWKGLVDGKTGYLYFWNPETNVTQYERPAAPPKPSSVPSSSVQVQQSSQGRCRSPDFSDRYDRNGNGGSDGSGSRSYQSSKVGTFSSHNNVENGTHVAESVSSIKGHVASDTGPALTPEAYRRRHEITVTGDNVPPPVTSFASSGFPSEILREVQNAGFSAPTPIQAQSWPIALQSKDIVAIAKTGSGKTLGYLLPAFIHLKRTNNNAKMGPTILVLSPTRELATQIQDEAVKFSKTSRIACTCLYGGAPKGPQLRDIDRGADIVVATPGRLNDILEMRRISLHQVSYLVLDEADRMLDMGFEPQIRKIVNGVPARRQTLMFTATWPKEVRKIAADLLVNPVQVNIGNVDELVANKSITQHIEVLAHMEKQRRLESILRSQDQGSKIIIFCSTKKMCDQLARNLTRQFGAAAIHGDKSQADRDHVLNQFRSGRTPVLVATDVAARGLDVKDIRVVVNFDFPTGVEDYVHRIGRTGRAGATGIAYTFFGDQDAKHASDLIKILEGANQKVPPELRELSSRGGGGFGKSRRYGSGGRGDSGFGAKSYDSGYGGRGNDSGYGGRGSDSSYGGRGSDSGYGGRGGYGSSAAFGRGGGRGFDYDSQRNERDRSPDRGSSWSDRFKTRERSRSPVKAAPSQYNAPVSFHQAMMERNGGGSDRNKNYNRERSRSHSPYRQDKGKSSPSTNSSPQKGWGGSSGVGRNGGSHPYNGELEEGMIPDEEGMIGHDESSIYQSAN